MLRLAAAPLVLALAARRLRRRRRRAATSPRRAHAGRRRGEREADPRATPRTRQTTLTIASKNFTEEFILGEIYAQALEAGGYKVRKRLDYGSEIVAFKGVKEGRIDAYPEYTGTALTTFFGVQPDEIPKDEQEAYEPPRRASEGRA